MGATLVFLIASLFLIIAGWIAISVYLFVIGIKFSSYLLKNHPNRWRELTSIGGSVGFSNPFKMFPYLFGNLDDEDENIAGYKNKIKLGMRYLLLALVVLSINLSFLILIAFLAQS